MNAGNVTKSKRKRLTRSCKSDTKKQREKDAIILSTSPFDLLCDNTLLKILSYSDDIRALIHLARCTSRPLRARFDPQSSGQCAGIWPELFKGLNMEPLDDKEDGRVLDYPAAINNRMVLHQRLIGHEKRAKAKGDAKQKCFQLPLRHYYFKPLNCPWILEPIRGDDTMLETFALVSGGTGEEIIIIDPESDYLQFHGSIMSESIICLEKSFQKRLVADSDYTGAATLHETITEDVFMKAPDQYLGQFSTCGIVQTPGWKYYFGDGTPFATAAGNYEQFPCLKYFDLSICTLDLMESDRISLKERGIMMMRSVKDVSNGEKRCNELIFWGDSGHELRSEIQRYVTRGIFRIPGAWSGVEFSVEEGVLYALFDEKNHRYLPTSSRPRVEDIERAVFRYPLSTAEFENVSSNELGIEEGTHYIEPDCFFLAGSEVFSLLIVENNLLLVGTADCLEFWNGKERSHIRTIHAGNPFPDNDDEAPIFSIQRPGDASLRYGFFTEQQDDIHGTVISLWQPASLDLSKPFSIEHADFQKLAMIKYPCFPKVLVLGQVMAVLGYDRYGSLYLDIYRIRCRFEFVGLEDVNLPKDVEMTNLHPRSKRCIRFVNRIKVHHRIEIIPFQDERGHEPKMPLFDMNDRFIVISANNGIVGSDGAKKSGEGGLIVIDLNEYGL